MIHTNLVAFGEKGPEILFLAVSAMLYLKKEGVGEHVYYMGVCLVFGRFEILHDIKNVKFSKLWNFIKTIKIKNA